MLQPCRCVLAYRNLPNMVVAKPAYIVDRLGIRIIWLSVDWFRITCTVPSMQMLDDVLNAC